MTETRKSENVCSLIRDLRKDEWDPRSCSIVIEDISANTS